MYFHVPCAHAELCPCKNKDNGSDTTAPAENTAEDTTSSLEDIINALNGVDTTDS